MCPSKSSEISINFHMIWNSTITWKNSPIWAHHEDSEIQFGETTVIMDIVIKKNIQVHQPETNPIHAAISQLFPNNCNHCPATSSHTPLTFHYAHSTGWVYGCKYNFSKIFCNFGQASVRHSPDHRASYHILRAEVSEFFANSAPSWLLKCAVL